MWPSTSRVSAGLTLATVRSVCDPRGKFLAEGPRDKDAVVAADLNLDLIDEVRSVWQFYRDRRPDAYGPLVAP